MDAQVLVVGATGLLGTDVVAELARRGYTIDAPGREYLDISDSRSMEAHFLSVRPKWIVNCAGYTAVDACESNEEEAFLLNSAAPFLLARFAGWVGARLVHMSTDFVFDGESNVPYSELDTPNPLSVYGRSKLHGEISLLSENPESIIVRTAWLFGAHGKCFPKTIIAAAKEGKPLRVVNDQTGSPTYTRDLAVGIANLLGVEPPAGVYHIVNSGQATWYELAKWTLVCAGIEAQIEQVTTAEWPAPAKRPKYSVLSSSKYVSLGFEPLPDWKDAIRRFEDEISSSL